MSAIKAISEINGTVAITEGNAMNATAIALLDSPGIGAIYGTPEPEGCGAPGCVRIACGLDEWQDYCAGWNEGGRLFDDNDDPRTVGVPQNVDTDCQCAWFKGVHYGWLAAQYHADQLCVTPIQDEPDTGEDYSVMDEREPEPGPGERHGPDDECAWMENYDDARRYTEDAFHVVEPEDVRG